MTIAPNSIINGDCLEVVMKDIADRSIDCIICDLPYGVTSLAWDVVIPFDLLWEQYKRIIKPITLFGSQPFTSALVMSNPKWFKYCWYWKKSKPNGWQHSKNKPMTAIEECAVFSGAPMGHASLLAEKRMKYYPQGVKQEKVRKVTTTAHGRSMGARLNQVGKEYQAFTGFPHNVLTFGNMTASQALHPTQKPVPLIEYLIKTYTQEGELILDNTAGSGTLVIAAINTNRNYICIEKDPHYFEVMRNRIENHDPFAPVKTKKPKPAPKGQLTLFDGGLAV